MNEAVREYAETMMLKRELERDLKAVKDKLEELMPSLLNEFTDDGILSVKVSTGHGTQTVFTSTTIRGTNKIDMDTTVKAFKEAGLGHMVIEKVDHNTLSAFVREHESSGQALPEPIAEAVDVIYEQKLGVRQS